MTPPSDREDTLCAMFESFCAATIRNFGRNLKRAMKNRQKHDGTSEESVDYLIGQLSTEDVYTAEQFVLEVDGLLCSVENELLYNALLSLPDRERRVILYDFWCSWTDKEISKKLEVTVRTVYNLRQRAFKKIRTYYELHGQGPDPYAFCYDGIEPGGVVAVSTVGVARNKEAKQLWFSGMDEALRRLEPSMVLCYGTPIGYDFGEVPVKFYEPRKFAGCTAGRR